MKIEPVSDEVRLLDHGYLKFVEPWGSDERIVEAARMSTGKGFQGWGKECPYCDGRGHRPEDKPSNGYYTCRPCEGTGEISGDEKLLAYLYGHKHATPFEMAGMVVEVKAPIFVFREWHRHRTQSYNEMSARYVPLPNENYVPTVERLMIRGGANKQAQSVGESITVDQAMTWQEQLERVYENAECVYQMGLVAGVPKELARLSVPVARYSRMRASANLRNWLAFLTLRMDPAAQWEIRQYAKAIAALVKREFPRTYALFADEHCYE